MSLTAKQKKLLKSFQSDQTRLIEEQFAQILTERSDVRLFFINENQCFTDGKNIIIDPAARNLFVDREALLDAERFLHLNSAISADTWLALQMQTRAGNIHESLHIIYTTFPTGIKNDKRSTNKARVLVLSVISNLIEDAFIEAAGCSLYDNLEHYLLWNRVALFFSRAQVKDTLEWKFEKSGIKLDTERAIDILDNNKTELAEITYNEDIKYACLMVYLHHLGLRLLYPFYKFEEAPEQILEYIEKTEELYTEGAMCGNPDKRYEYVQKIFDIIEPLIPDNPDMPMHPAVSALISGARTHSSENISFDNYANRGKEAAVTRRLFTEESGALESIEQIKEKIESAIEAFLFYKIHSTSFDKEEAVTVVYDYKDFECSDLHKNIKLLVVKPKINRNLKKAYQNMAAKFRLSINSYSSRIGHYLKGSVSVKEDKKLFGSGISSRHFGDIKKRYWYRKGADQGIPDIGFLFMIDGSGSMGGERLDGVTSAMVILHEVFSANSIQHSIVEHRAIYDKPELVHNILVDFNCREEEKYNILNLEAEEGTREGFSLYWAENYLLKNCSSEYKTLILISDGAPSHRGDEESVDYVPPVSVKDTAEAVKKIVRRGTHIVALALDMPGGYECYEDLKRIYPNVVSCVDITKLTGQLLRIISRIFQGRIR